MNGLESRMVDMHKPNLELTTILIKDTVRCIKIDLSEIENREEIFRLIFLSLCRLLVCFVIERSRGINVESLENVQGN